MSGSDIMKNSGFTGCLQKVGLAIGSTPAELAWATPDGTSGFNYVIDGIAYYLADDASEAMSAMATQAVSTVCLYIAEVDTAGAMTTVKGTEVPTADIEFNPAQWPFPSEDKCPIGGFKVETNSTTTYTGATTNLNAGGITDTYYDFALGIPLVPQTAV